MMSAKSKQLKEVYGLNEQQEDVVELVYEIYESKPYPVVVHVFKGETKEEAQQYFEAHLKTDKFLADCYNQGKFNDIDCKVKSYWK